MGAAGRVDAAERWPAARSSSACGVYGARRQRGEAEATAVNTSGKLQPVSTTPYRLHDGRRLSWDCCCGDRAHPIAWRSVAGKLTAVSGRSKDP